MYSFLEITSRGQIILKLLRKTEEDGNRWESLPNHDHTYNPACQGNTSNLIGMFVDSKFCIIIKYIV